MSAFPSCQTRKIDTETFCRRLENSEDAQSSSWLVTVNVRRYGGSLLCCLTQWGLHLECLLPGVTGRHLGFTPESVINLPAKTPTAQNPRALTALPVFNEAEYVNEVLDEVAQYSENVLVVDDGSTDGTSALLEKRGDIRLLTHPENRGYGAALSSAFEYAAANDFDIVVTIDCDGQHEPQRIPLSLIHI